MDNDEIRVNAKEWFELLRRDKILTALESGGVDNWEWYSDSLKDITDE